MAAPLQIAMPPLCGSIAAIGPFRGPARPATTSRRPPPHTKEQIRLTLPVECPLSLPIIRKPPFRFRPTQVTAALRPSRSLNRSSSLLESGRQVGSGYRPSWARNRHAPLTSKTPICVRCANVYIAPVRAGPTIGRRALHAIFRRKVIVATRLLPLLRRRRGLCGNGGMAHASRSICRGARARQYVQGQCRGSVDRDA